MKKISVALADDNELSLDMLRAITEMDEQIEVVGEAQTGMQAIQLVEDAQPDVMLLDVVMPFGDGLEVLNQVRESGNTHTRFIMVSAVGDEKIASDAFAMGADYYIVKPYRADAILREIRRSVEREMSGKKSHKEARVYRNPRNDEGVCRRREITRLLLAVGVPAQLNGYQYLREAIYRTVEDVESISSVTRTLYPSLAEQFGVTPASVERAIRHAIETSWARGNVETIDRIFGYTVDEQKGKPTNTEFIAMLADHVRMGYC